MIRSFIAWSFTRHVVRLHGADYEVCGNWICRFAYWLERTLWPGGLEQ